MLRAEALGPRACSSFLPAFNFVGVVDVFSVVSSLCFSLHWGMFIHAHVVQIQCDTGSEEATLVAAEAWDRARAP
jgi:hypothetical protein